MKKWVVALLVGLALLSFGAGVGVNDNTIKCGSEIMSPGDSCDETRNGQVTSTRTYTEMKESHEAAQRTFNSWGRWALLGGGTLFTVLGIVGIVKVRRRRAAAGPSTADLHLGQQAGQAQGQQQAYAPQAGYPAQGQPPQGHAPQAPYPPQGQYGPAQPHTPPQGAYPAQPQTPPQGQYGPPQGQPQTPPQGAYPAQGQPYTPPQGQQYPPQQGQYSPPPGQFGPQGGQHPPQNFGPDSRY